MMWEEIKKHKKILLSLHVSPDVDSIGSCLAMKHVLEKIGKEVLLISGDDLPPNSANFLPGFESIKHMSFAEALKENIDLFIILDSGSPGQVSRKTLIDFKNLPFKTIAIDHHATNDNFADINLVDENLCSCAELLYWLMLDWDSTLMDKKVGTCLFAGIWTDTGGLKFNKVTANTYLVMAKLKEIGVEHDSVCFYASSQEYLGMKLVGAGVANSQVYFGGKVAIAITPNETYTQFGVSKEMTFGGVSASDELATCLDVFIVASITEKEKSNCRISFRSNNPAHHYDVSKIAQMFDGGGHMAAAGGRINNCTPKQAREKIIASIQQTYPDLGQP